jgi:transcriptional regulator with XRE-family HTH domain
LTPRKSQMEKSIGERVKFLRIDQGLTLAELGAKVNLSTSYLSQIERDRTQPSLSTLVNIAKALNVEPRHFFETGENSTLIVQAGQTNSVEYLNPETACYPLTPEDATSNLQVYRVVIQPGSQPYQCSPYSGEEMCFVLTGELTVVAGDETHTLEAGDSIHYDALLLHEWSNQAMQPCEFIWSRAGYEGQPVKSNESARTADLTGKEAY